jgi:hypothetical protein
MESAISAGVCSGFDLRGLLCAAVSHQQLENLGQGAAQHRQRRLKAQAAGHSGELLCQRLRLGSGLGHPAAASRWHAELR